MQNNSIVLSFLSIFTLVSFFITLIAANTTNKYKNYLLDRDFKKPQAFHFSPIPRIGGTSSVLSLILFFIVYFFLVELILLDYVVISLSLFILGFLDDIKIKINPTARLLLMISVLLFCIHFFSIKISYIDIKFLNIFFQYKFFSVLFVLLCFLFIINGANLIDGFNGLLGIQLVIINTSLMIVNLENNEINFAIFIAGQIIILLCFLLFNFPKAKIFLGDSGAYLFGSLVALNVINTNNLNPNIPSFFFCIILFYLFFEVFFSFFRKLLLKKSPLKPDNKHLHMLSYKYLKSLSKFKNCNHINSLLINFVYLLLIFPAFFLRNNAIFCKYWFFSVLILYILFYLRIYSSTKKQIDI